jgi:hypothetical protein
MRWATVAIREKALGPDHPDVATSLFNLAGLYYKPGSLRRRRADLQAGASDPRESARSRPQTMKLVELEDDCGEKIAVNVDATKLVHDAHDDDGIACLHEHLRGEEADGCARCAAAAARGDAGRRATALESLRVCESAILSQLRADDRERHPRHVCPAYGGGP